MYERLLEDQKEKGKKKKSITAENLLQDDRFKDLFVNDEFHIDKDSVAFQYSIVTSCFIFQRLTWAFVCVN